MFHGPGAVFIQDHLLEAKRNVLIFVLELVLPIPYKSVFYLKLKLY